METQTVDLTGISAKGVEFLRARIPTQHNTPFVRIEYRISGVKSATAFDIDKRALLGQMAEDMSEDDRQNVSSQISERIQADLLADSDYIDVYEPASVEMDPNF